MRAEIVKQNGTFEHLALSLVYYARVLEILYLRAAPAAALTPEPVGLRVALALLGLGGLASGVFPAPWVALAIHASAVLAP